MKRLVVYCLWLAATCAAQTVPLPPHEQATDTAAHSNLHPPQEDWARLGFYAADNAKLAAEKNPKPRVVFLGDSITFHWKDSKYTSFFQDHPNFIERGIPGNNTAQMLLRYRADVLALQPRVVVLFGGTNDLAAFKLPDNVAFAEESISSIVELAMLHHEGIILCSLLPVTDAIKPQTTERKPDDILRLNAWMKSYATEKHIPFVDFYSAVTDGHDRLRADLTIDGLHPNGAGYKLMEPLLMPVIVKEISAR